MTTQPETSPEWPSSNTEHGLLVAFGEFLNQHGLLKRLRAVPIPQKAGAAGNEHAPQERLIEFLAGIMSGMEHLADLNAGAHPVARDAVVAHAWGQERFAHSSSVSRTLSACDEDTLAAVEQAIDEFSRPFIASSIQELLHAGVAIVYDLDLLGQAVSATSTSYPAAAFGWMDDQVKLGYQLARVCLTRHDGSRIWLAGFHHPGNTVSVSCMRELVRAAEQQTGVRPRRRTEYIQRRVAAQQAVLSRTAHWIEQQQTTAQRLTQTRDLLIGKRYHTQHVLQQKTPLSERKTAHLKQQMAGWDKRLARLEQQQSCYQAILAQHQAQHLAHEHTLTQLQQWVLQLTADNATNPDPPAYCEVRMDAGFTSGENIAWLLEMGYCPNTKATNDQITRALRRRTQTCWVRVGENAELTAWDNYSLHQCPYPVTVALERFKVGTAFRYATLIHFRDDGQMPTLPQWFTHYNQRQTIEAGNKEMKGTFFVQHLMSRALCGIRLQVLFTGVAANAVRWCQPWLHRCSTDNAPEFKRRSESPKWLVRVAANSAAWVQRTSAGTAMQFAPSSALQGVTLFLSGVPAFQLSLGLFQPFKNASPCTICLPVAQHLR